MNPEAVVAIVGTVPFGVVGLATGAVIGTLKFVVDVLPWNGIISVQPLTPLVYSAQGCKKAVKLLWEI